MPAPAWENLGDFLDLDGFAVEVVLYVGGVARAPIPVIFDEQYFDAQLGEYEMATGSPHFTCRESDIAGLRKYDKALIGAQWYEVEHDPKPDGTGMAVVHLFRGEAP